MVPTKKEAAPSTPKLSPAAVDKNKPAVAVVPSSSAKKAWSVHVPANSFLTVPDDVFAATLGRMLVRGGENGPAQERVWLDFAANMSIFVQAFYSNAMGALRGYWDDHTPAGGSDAAAAAAEVIPDATHSAAITMLHMLLKASQYELLSEEVFNAAEETNFEMTIPISLRWSRLEQEPLRSWVSSKGLYPSDPYFARHLLIFTRGLQQHTTEGLFIREKISILLGLTWEWLLTKYPLSLLPKAPSAEQRRRDMQAEDEVIKKELERDLNGGGAARRRSQKKQRQATKKRESTQLRLPQRREPAPRKRSEVDAFFCSSGSGSDHDDDANDKASEDEEVEDMATSMLKYAAHVRESQRPSVQVDPSTLPSFRALAGPGAMSSGVVSSGELTSPRKEDQEAVLPPMSERDDDSHSTKDSYGSSPAKKAEDAAPAPAAPSTRSSASSPNAAHHRAPATAAGDLPPQPPPACDPVTLVDESPITVVRSVFRYPLERFVRENDGWRCLFKRAVLQEVICDSVILLFRPHRVLNNARRLLQVREFSKIAIGDLNAVMPDPCVQLPPVETISFVAQAFFIVVFLHCSLQEILDPPQQASTAATALVAADGAEMSSPTSGGSGWSLQAVLIPIVLFISLASRLYTLVSNYVNAVLYHEGVLNRWLDKHREGRNSATLAKLTTSVCGQETKEILLAYILLWQMGPMVIADIHSRADAFVRKEFPDVARDGFSFDVQDAVQKLVNLQLVTHDEKTNRYRVVVKPEQWLAEHPTDHLTRVSVRGIV